MKDKTKLRIISVLKGFNYLLLFVIFILGILSLSAIRQNTKAAEANTAATEAVVRQIAAAVTDLKADSHHDHDTQLRAVECIVNLFGSKPGQIITEAEFDACLAGTRIAPAGSTNQSQPSTSSPVPLAPLPPPNQLYSKTNTQAPIGGQGDKTNKEKEPKGIIPNVKKFLKDLPLVGGLL